MSLASTLISGWSIAAHCHVQILLDKDAARAPAAPPGCVRILIPHAWRRERALALRADDVAPACRRIADQLVSALACRCVVFCKMDCMPALCMFVFPLVRERSLFFCLVTGMSDTPVDEPLIRSVHAACGDSVRAWYCVNRLSPYEPFPIRTLPIGTHDARPFADRWIAKTNMLAVAVNPATSPTHRNAVVAALAANGFPNQTLSPSAFRVLLQCSTFTASPRGHGLDCYRTWEALHAGSIPLCDASWHVGHRDFAHLPIVWVHDWSLVTRAFLQEQQERIEAEHPRWYDRVRAYLHPRAWAQCFAQGAFHRTLATPMDLQSAAASPASPSASAPPSASDFVHRVQKEQERRTLIVLNNSQTALFAHTTPDTVFKMIKSTTAKVRTVDGSNVMTTARGADDAATSRLVAAHCGSLEPEHEQADDTLLCYVQRRMSQCEPGDIVSRAIAACTLLHRGLRTGVVVCDVNGRQFGIDRDGWTRTFDAHELLCFDPHAAPPPNYVLRFILEHIRHFCTKHFAESFNMDSAFAQRVVADCDDTMAALGRSLDEGVRTVAFVACDRLLWYVRDQLKRLAPLGSLQWEEYDAPAPIAHDPLLRLVCPHTILEQHVRHTMSTVSSPLKIVDMMYMNDSAHESTSVCEDVILFCTYRRVIHRLSGCSDAFKRRVVHICGPWSFTTGREKKYVIFDARISTRGSLQLDVRTQIS